MHYVKVRSTEGWNYEPGEEPLLGDNMFAVGQMSHKFSAFHVVRNAVHQDSSFHAQLADGPRPRLAVGKGILANDPPQSRCATIAVVQGYGR